MIRDRIAKVRAKSLKRLRNQSTVNPPPVVEQDTEPLGKIAAKRESKYIAKFGFACRPISKQIQSGKRMGTPAVIKPGKEREILKYLKDDEV